MSEQERLKFLKSTGQIFKGTSFQFSHLIKLVAQCRLLYTHSLLHPRPTPLLQTTAWHLL